MTKIKNNIFLLGLTTIFLFLSCLLINSYSNKYSVNAKYEDNIILDSYYNNLYMCEVNDSPSDFMGDIVYDLNLYFYTTTYEFRFNFYKAKDTLNFISEKEHLYELSFIIDDINYNGEIIKPSLISYLSIFLYFNFDFSQYPIESAFQYSNPTISVEIELELNNDDYIYFNTPDYEIPFTNEFDNPFIINLNNSSYIGLANDNYSWGFEDGYYRGYHDGLSENNEGLGQAYEQGYNDGYNDSSLNPMTFISSIFSGINEIFSVEIFPGFKIWYLIGAPLIVALIIGVLKFLR